MTDLTLWHVPASRSTRVRWLLEEIGCAYRLETLTSPDSIDAALHPPRAPALRDGNVTMHETGAMTEWLCETRAVHLWRAPGASAGSTGRALKHVLGQIKAYSGWVHGNAPSAK